MQFISNTQIETEKLEKDKLLSSITKSPEVVLDSLAAHIRTNWEKARRAKVPIEDQMIKMKRRREGVYDPDMLAAIRELHGPTYNPVFMMITETKCRAAESWIKDIEFQPGQIPWDLEPTPLPEIPPSIQQFISENAQEALTAQIIQEAVIQGIPVTPELIQQRIQEAMPKINERIDKEIKKHAKKIAGKMKLKIKDQFAEGEWEKAFDKAIYDVVTYKKGFIKGPIYQKEVIRKRILNEETGRWEPSIETRIVQKYERRSPFDIYPAPDSNGIDDGYLFDKIALTPKSLANLIGVPGYNGEAIREVLQQYRHGGLREWTTIDSARAELEGKSILSVFEGEKIDCLEYQGTAQGRMLREWGLSSRVIEDDEKEYDIVAWLIGRHVIKAIINPDINGKKNISGASFIEDPDAFWGKGVPDLIEDIQYILNAIARAIVNNIGVASGPQVVVNVDRLAPGASTKIWPYKIWRVTNKQMQEAAPIEFHMPPMIVDKLMIAMEQFLKLADEASGVPRYAHGDTTVGGAGKTATGLSMLMTQAARGIKASIRNIDNGLIVGTVQRQFHMNMEFEDDMGIFGDVKIVAKGSSSMIAKEQLAVRRKEFLDSTMNMYDMMIMGLPGRAELLKENAKSLDLEVDMDKVFQDEETLASMMMPGMEGTGNQGDIEKPQTLDKAGQTASGSNIALFQDKRK